MELPDDVALSWIPGPSGTLRVAERHPGGRLALVLVHGLAGRLEHWAPVIRGLGPGLRVLAVDLPGHGESDPARPPDYTVPALASSIAAVAEIFALRRMVLVAHSLGALAAIEFAGRHPERVSGLLLIDPSGDQSYTPPADREVLLEAIRKDPRGECEANYRHFLAAARPEVARRVLEDLEATPDDVLAGALEGSASYAPLAALERWGGPVASVVSELNDSPVSLHRLDRGLRVRHVPGASHWLMMDRPREVLEILWDFLEVCRDSPARRAASRPGSPPRR
jgi:pimeloyl-ACP methyl ester carboxylesterase